MPKPRLATRRAQNELWKRAYACSEAFSAHGESGAIPLAIGPYKAYLDSFRKIFLLTRHNDQTAVVSSAPVWSVRCSGPRWKLRAGMPIVRSAFVGQAFCRRVPAPVRPVCHPLRGSPPVKLSS